MKITDNSPNPGALPTFESLQPGDTLKFFQAAGKPTPEFEGIFIKTNGHGTRNVLRLSDGKLLTAFNNAIIANVDAELYIRGDK